MTIAHIFNGELGFDVRTKLNDVIDIVNTPPSGGMAIGGAITSATAGSVLFAGAAGVLAQDNTNFFFDDTTNDLKIGGRYQIGSANAAFTVPHGTANNWFLGGAGNTALTGYGNFGEGDYALASTTSGYGNMAMGAASLQTNSTGYYNVAMGFLALNNNTTGSNNMALGTGSLQYTTIGNNNAAIGTEALKFLQNGSNNLGLGTSAGGIVPTSNDSLFIGAYTGIGITTSYANTLVGAGAGYALAGSASRNTLIGWGSGGQMLSNCQDNTMVGGRAGFNLNGTSNANTLIGMWQGPSSAMSNVIALSDGNAVVKADYGYSNAGWTFVGSPKAGAPANTDMPSGSFAVIDDTSANKTWLAFNKAGVIRQTEIGGAGGGGGMAIGGAITGGTASRVLFTGVGGILDDDSTFTWNDTLKDLAIGGAYYVNAARALYVVPHVTENNWFEGNSGNQTLSGYGNFATGDLALQSVTSGYDNVGVGTRALQFVTDGYNNFAFGSFALNYTVSDRNNVAIGAFALEDLGTSGIGGGNNTNNIAIGFGAINNLKQGYSNVGIGSSALANIAGTTTAYQNTIVGASAGSYLGVAAGGGAVAKNIMIGANAALNLQGVSSYNTWIGGFQGPSAVINGTICLSTGGGEGSLLEYNIAKAGVWSFHTDPNVGYAASIHLYNTQVAIGDIGANYERAILDWRNPLNVFRLGMEIGGTGTKRLVCIDGYTKAGAPASGDLPASSFAVIDDTSGGATWLVFNSAGTIRKVQLT